jgi:hypothetical protein
MNPENLRILQYKWNYSEGFVSLKSGPPRLHEVQSLLEEGEDDMDVQRRSNRCLFLSTLRVTFRGNTRNKILQEMG